MITYSQLGNNGRLGNQMFQYATLFSIGLTRGFEIGIPKDTKISKVFDLKHANLLDSMSVDKIYKERDFSFDASIFAIPDCCDINGYFQSGFYFNACKEAIFKEFKFKSDIEEKASHNLQEYPGKNLCTLHIRRGDYKTLSHYHTNLGSDYYKSAINIIMNSVSSPHFLVFSDEPEWCKREIIGDNFSVVDLKDDAVELCMMSKCKLHVISNSSYSWWGAYLSNSPAVVAPKNWFGPQGPQNFNSIYENEWVRV